MVAEKKIGKGAKMLTKGQRHDSNGEEETKDGTFEQEGKKVQVKDKEKGGSCPSCDTYQIGGFLVMDDICPKANIYPTSGLRP
ncbi:hypothetical protein LIER_20392 [Lithospermum erythrorhizon]|uniref:Uncharacterized protein n=1 Tax=Lithospermum erythrorhizon TaxID=34254 RepID=A0AAV3QP37_LITER